MKRTVKRANGFALGLLLPCLAAGSGTEQITILYAEALSMTVEAAAEGFDERLWFDAFGRRFELNLRQNDRLQRQRRNPATQIMSGNVANSPGSWVRLVRRGEKISGVIRTESGTWLVDPLARVASRISDTGADIRTTNIVYRLADTLVPAGTLECGADTSAMNQPSSGAVIADRVFDELEANPRVLFARGAAERVHLGAVGDFELFENFGPQTEDAILTRMNIVDGIFTEDVGLEIAVDSVTVFSSSSDPFTSTAEPEDLLEEVFDYRAANQSSLGLTHLITGRTFNGNIAGIAFLGDPGVSGVCTTSGVGVSEGGSSAPISSGLGTRPDLKSQTRRRIPEVMSKRPPLSRKAVSA